MANSEKREIFCILKFKTIYPDGLSQELLEAFKRHLEPSLLSSSVPSLVDIPLLFALKT